MLCATVCRFKREEGSKWERGIAICTAPGLYDVALIAPLDATTSADVVGGIWCYELLWQQGTIVVPVMEEEKIGK